MAIELVSLVASAATIVPCLLYFCGLCGHDAMKVTALIGTIVWFMATPMWTVRELTIDMREVEI